MCTAECTHVVLRPYCLTATMRSAVRPVAGIQRAVRPTARAGAVRPTVHPVAVVIQRAVRLVGASGFTPSVPSTVRPLSAVPPAAVRGRHVQSPAVPETSVKLAFVPAAVRPSDDSAAIGQTVFELSLLFTSTRWRVFFDIASKRTTKIDIGCVIILSEVFVGILGSDKLFNVTNWKRNKYIMMFSIYHQPNTRILMISYRLPIT